MARIVSVVLRNQRSILTVCAPIDEIVGVPDVTVALPFLVGGQGVLRTCLFELSNEEHARLRASAQIVRDAIASLEAADG